MLILGPGSPAIITIGNGLSVWLLDLTESASIRVGHNYRAFITGLESGCVSDIYDPGPGKNGTQLVRPQCDWQLFPVEKISTDRMAPGTITTLTTKGIMLKEQVVFSLIIHQSVGIIAPVKYRGEVELGAEWLMIACRILQHFSQPLLVADSLPGSVYFVHLRYRANMGMQYHRTCYNSMYASLHSLVADITGHLLQPLQY